MGTRLKEYSGAILAIWRQCQETWIISSASSTKKFPQGPELLGANTAVFQNLFRLYFLTGIAALIIDSLAQRKPIKFWSQNQNFVNSSKKFLKNINQTFLVVCYFTWKLEFVSNILSMIVESFIFCCTTAQSFGKKKYIVSVPYLTTLGYLVYNSCTFVNYILFYAIIKYILTITIYYIRSFLAKFQWLNGFKEFHLYQIFYWKMISSQNKQSSILPRKCDRL